MGRLPAKARAIAIFRRRCALAESGCDAFGAEAAASITASITCKFSLSVCCLGLSNLGFSEPYLAIAAARCNRQVRLTDAFDLC